jgi:hypothetical protein
VSTQPPNGRHIGWLFGVRVKREVLGNSPQKYLVSYQTLRGPYLVWALPCNHLSPTPTNYRQMGSYGTMRMIRLVWRYPTHQSVSSTAAVCPRKRGRRSGRRPRSLTGMTANAPPPLASQLTEMYSGLAYSLSDSPSFNRSSIGRRTLIKFVSQAFLDIRRLS